MRESSAVPCGTSSRVPDTSSSRRITGASPAHQLSCHGPQAELSLLLPLISRHPTCGPACSVFCLSASCLLFPLCLHFYPPAGLGPEYFRRLLQSNCGVSVIDFTPSPSPPPSASATSASSPALPSSKSSSEVVVTLNRLNQVLCCTALHCTALHCQIASNSEPV